AKRAFAGWERLPSVERAAYLRKLAQCIREHVDELTEIITAEQGKVLSLARGEVLAAAAYLDFTADMARLYTGEVVPSDRRDEHVLILRRPIGVVLGILPWNYPLFLLVRKLGPALLAGNTIVIKPSEETPVNTLFAARLIAEAGFPTGVVNVVPGGRETGRLLCANRDVGMITFTGSVATGAAIMREAAQHITKVSLELGGKAPSIVMRDAELDLAVQCVRDSRIHNAGQVCNCTERVYVQRPVYDEFLSRLADAMRAVRYGDPRDERNEIGPLVSKARQLAVKQVVDQAVADEAQIVTGGGFGIHERGYYFEPTVLTNVGQSMDVVQKEVFGPVLPVLPFDDFDEAMALANDTEYGLTSSIFTRDLKTAMQAARTLQFGETYINRAHSEAMQAFHGGWKRSGIGGADGIHGLEEYFNKQVVYIPY
ncbi:MAG: aldehyde dehydrogenase, partial [Alicyclobacillus sp.]|nr:aldehyde dehydrogenase [Alicyclobacillus sp.]